MQKATEKYSILNDQYSSAGAAFTRSRGVTDRKKFRKPRRNIQYSLINIQYSSAGAAFTQSRGVSIERNAENH